MKILALRAPLQRHLASVSPSDRRALRLGAWLLGPMLMYLWVINPIRRDFVAQHSRLVRDRDVLMREQALVASATMLREEFAATDKVLEVMTVRLFGGSGAVSATATMARLASDCAARHRVMVQASETQPAEPVPGDLLQLSVQMRAVGDLAGIMDWIAELENGPKLIRIDELRIVAADQAPGDEPKEEVLGVHVRLVGYAVAVQADSSVRSANQS